MAVAAQLGKDGQPVVSPEKSDRRFSGEKWRNNPFFSFLMQSYLVNAEMLKSAVEQAEIDEKTKTCCVFFDAIHRCHVTGKLSGDKP